MKKKSIQQKTRRIDLSLLPPPPPPESEWESEPQRIVPLHPDGVLPPKPPQSRRKPKNVPGLFLFEWCSTSKGWFAICDEPLKKTFDELSDRDLHVIDLAQALALVGSHRPHDFRVLNSRLDSNIHHDNSVLLVKSESQGRYRCMAEHCIQLGRSLHKALGNDFTLLLDTFFGLSDPKPTHKQLRSRLTRILSETLMYAVPGPGLPKGRGRPMQTVECTFNARKTMVPLALRAIQIALDLATELGRSPTKSEVKKRLEEIHPKLQASQRPHVSAINWTPIFKAAGLGSLPKSSQLSSCG